MKKIKVINLIKTGYFHNLRDNEIKGAISIAIGDPIYYKPKFKINELTPGWELLRLFKDGEINIKEYIEIYNKQLEKLDPTDILYQCLELTNGETPVLLCHCDKNGFCHRHLVASWLEKSLNIDVEEYDLGKVKRDNGKILRLI